MTMSALEQDAVRDDQRRADELEAWSPGKESLLWLTLAALQVTWLVVLGRAVLSLF